MSAADDYPRLAGEVVAFPNAGMSGEIARAFDEIDLLRAQADRLRNALIDHMVEHHPSPARQAFQQRLANRVSGCPTCGGTGKVKQKADIIIPTGRCETCDGSGRGVSGWDPKDPQPEETP